MAAPPVAITGRASKQRVFLIIDLKDSSAAAKRLGEVDFHHLLQPPRRRPHRPDREAERPDP